MPIHSMTVRSWLVTGLAWVFVVTWVAPANAINMPSKVTVEVDNQLGYVLSLEWDTDPGFPLGPGSGSDI